MSGIQLLIIEDDHADQHLIRRALASGETSRWVLDVVATLAEARERLTLRDYELILLDANLPDASYPETLDEMLKYADDIPVVMLTGVEDPELGREVVSRGVQDWIPKQDLNPRLLQRALLHTLERRRRQQLEQQMVHNDKLASLGKLVAGVAHEINNPTTFILLNQHVAAKDLQQLREAVTTPAELELIDRIHGNLNDNISGMYIIRDLVRNLSSLSRDERCSVETIDLNEVIRQACALAAATISRRATLVMALDELPLLQANRNRFTQLVLNLLTNAAHAIERGSPKDNRITVRTYCVDDAIHLVIIDTGVGIPPRNQRKIFEPFYTTRSKEKGTGLGLTIVSDTVRLHGGRIDVASTVGEGTRIHIVVPLESPLASTPQSATPISPRTDGPRRRLLLIDDEVLLTQAMLPFLEEAFEVVCVNDGVLALQMMESAGSYDLILCDLIMPDVDGVTLFESLNDSPELQRRFVFMTGGTFTDRAREFVQQLPRPVLRKPLAPDALLAQLIGVLRSIDAQGPQ